MGNVQFGPEFRAGGRCPGRCRERLRRTSPHQIEMGSMVAVSPLILVPLEQFLDGAGFFWCGGGFVFPTEKIPEESEEDEDQPQHENSFRKGAEHCDLPGRLGIGFDSWDLVRGIDRRSRD